MRRLYLQIYVAFLGIVLLLGVLVTLSWWLAPAPWHDRRMFEGLAALVAESLPGPGQPTALLLERVEELARRFNADLAVRGPDGALLAAAGRPLPAQPPELNASGWFRSRGRSIAALKLPDGRWVLAHGQNPRPAAGLLITLAAAAAVVALGAYPLARRITGRLERLQSRVEALGAGVLTTRVEVEGADEVASLARSFNHAADRIQALVAAQKTLLASVSHELRTPLTRIRMAVELLPADTRPELRARMARDVAELDGLIGELLLASRLDTVEPLAQSEDVDLLALLAEEAAENGAEVAGEPTLIQGDPRLLRRLIRNLLVNANRHAEGAPVEASLGPLAGGGARLSVADRGPGVPEAERERIFEPFYRPPGPRSSGEGVGLGLALVRQIARRHGGEARCMPREGGGTCFVVDLRGVHPPASPPAP